MMHGQKNIKLIKFIFSRLNFACPY